MKVVGIEKTDDLFPAHEAHGRVSLRLIRQVILIFSLLAIVLNREYIPNIFYDRLNVIPLLASLYLGYTLQGWKRGLIDGRSRDIAKLLLPSSFIRYTVLAVVLFITAEFGLRFLSYHRPLFYERQGDLLYTPVPDQDYVEKISLTKSHVNSYGLRGGSAVATGKKIILCMGDSVTFGYGVDDKHTYPAELQKNLDQKYPGRFLVLNGGVDGYPTEFMRRKFLYLWNLGIHPNIVIVGYSFNEGGWLPQLQDIDAAAKDRIASRVRMKNFVRNFALYNLVVENWGRTLYDRMKKYAVPEHPMLSSEQARLQYRQHLEDFRGELEAHRVNSVFALFAGYDVHAQKTIAQGIFQTEFDKFAKDRSLSLVGSDEVLGDAPSSTLRQYFQDQCHMTPKGNEKFAQGLAQSISEVLN